MKEKCKNKTKEKKLKDKIEKQKKK